jgi:hypothetical protein
MSITKLLAGPKATAAKPEAVADVAAPAANPAGNPEAGGTYEMRNGVRVLVEPATPDHPEGNRARPAPDAAAAAGAVQTDH